MILALCILINELGKAQAKQSKTDRELQDVLLEYDKWHALETKIREWDHNQKYRLASLESYLDTGDLPGLRNQLTKMRNDVQAHLSETISLTGNRVVDAMLHSKSEICQNEGITFDLETAPISSMAISDLDLSILVGNLLDNAIEACARLESGRERAISVRIGQTGDTFRFHIRNTSNGQYRYKGQYLSTTKHGEDHGLGLKSVQQIVKRVRGILQVQPKEMEFRVDVFIPMNKMY